MLDIADILAKLGEEGVVSVDGGYLYHLKRDYEGYVKQGRYDLVALERLVAELPNSRAYRKDILKSNDFERYRAELNRRLELERAHLLAAFTASLQAFGVHCNQPFKQSEHTKGLKNAMGICFAASMDWLRRKMWNATRRDRKPMHDLWQDARLTKRLAKLDGLQSVRSNFVDPQNTLQLYDRRRTDHHRHVDKRKAFGALLAGGTRHEMEEVDFERTYDDIRGSVRVACSRVIQEGAEAVGPESPLGVVFELTQSAARGHAVALFRHVAADGWRWSLFDPNHGEFMMKSSDLPAGSLLAARWYELYFGGKFTPTFTAVLPVA